MECCFAPVLPTRRSDLVTRDIDGEVVILDRATEKIHRLNPTASLIWNHCDGKSTATEIATRVAASFENPPDDIVEDVIATIASWRRLGLLVSSGQED